MTAIIDQSAIETGCIPGVAITDTPVMRTQ